MNVHSSSTMGFNKRDPCGARCLQIRVKTEANQFAAKLKRKPWLTVSTLDDFNSRAFLMLQKLMPCSFVLQWMASRHWTRVNINQKAFLERKAFASEWVSREKPEEQRNENDSADTSIWRCSWDSFSAWIISGEVLLITAVTLSELRRQTQWDNLIDHGTQKQFRAFDVTKWQHRWCQAYANLQNSPQNKFRNIFSCLSEIWLLNVRTHFL